MKDLTVGLNENQKNAVLNSNEKLLILAGPGAGKTMVATRKIAYLLEERISPEKIYCISFTRAAAEELATRICKINRKRGKDVSVSTFHMFVINFMEKFMDIKFTIINDSEKEILIENICKRYKLKNSKILLSTIKKTLDSEEKSIKYAIEEYIFKLNQLKLMDIDLVLPLFLKKIKQDPKVLREIQEDIEYIIYDEAQDINYIQYEIITTLIPKNSDKGLILIGDDDQNIYSWNGTDVKYILNFPTEYNASTALLDQNYRSTNQIIDASNNLISANKNRFNKIIKGFRDGEKVEILNFNDENEEKMRLLGISIAFIDCEKSLGILCRSNNEIKQIMSLFKQYNVPFTSSIKETYNKHNVNLLRLCANTQNDLLIESIFEINKDIKIEALENKTSIFNVLLNKNNDLARKIHKVSQLFKNNSAILAYQYAESILGFKDSAIREAIVKWSEQTLVINNIDNFLYYLETKSGQDILKEIRNNINILTIHGSKGLEYDEIIIYNCTNNNFSDRTNLIEDNRRLLYVAMTRAKDKLRIMYPNSIKSDHKGLEISQISNLIEKDLCDKVYKCR